MGLILAGVPLAAAAQDAPPAGAPERVITFDGNLTGKTYDEFAPGTATGGWGVYAIDEIPIIGHNWAAQVDYRSYTYAHKALGGMPNGITFACPAGDQGCVTPIGWQTYDRVFSPGPMNYVNAFNVQDSTTQISLGSKIAPVERFYVSVGYVFRGTNAPGYPTESGMGFGIDKLPDADRTLSFYGNFWLFFNVGGNATGATSAALGTLSAYPFTVSYRMYSYRLGLTFKIPNSPLLVDLSDVGDNASITANAPSNAVHNALRMGVGVKF